MSEPVIEQIHADLFRIEVPLPRNPLKATNAYIIKGDRRNLVIDTGMNRDECRNALLAAFETLGVDLNITDFFVTHLHADHVGLVDELSAAGALIYFNRPDAEVLNYKNLWQLVCSLAGRHGFPADQVEQAIDSHPGQRYSPKNPVDFTMVEEGDTIRCGSYELQCVVTPGHTRGHTCLYDPKRRYFFSGDHVLRDITPNISTWLDDSNPLADYLSSLDKVARIPIELILPGHRRMIDRPGPRIEELKEHHRERLQEVLSIIGEQGPASAFDIASRMTWDLVADSWEQFPLMQKWFATGEALAHICYLEAEGSVGRKMDGQNMLFCRVGR